MKIGGLPAVVGRIGLTGELGYEIVVTAENELALMHALREAGAPHGMRLVGDRAADSLRLEKGYGIWSAEFRQDITPAMCGLDRFVAFDKGEFIGREAALAEKGRVPPRSSSCSRWTPPTLTPRRRTASGSTIAWSATSPRGPTDTTWVRAWRSPIWTPS